MRGTIRDPEERSKARKQWRLYHVPGYMRDEVRPLLPLLSRHGGLVMIDVGANKGFWSKAVLNSLPGRVEHIYQLDPSPENYLELTRRDDSLLFDPEDFERISAFCIAAGSKAGVATLFTDEDGSPVASLYEHKLSGAAGALFTGASGGGVRAVQLNNSLEVTTMTLDAFMENIPGQIDILKIDTEGYEYEVLTGADKALSSGRIDNVFFEFGCHQVESRHFFADFFSLFDSKKFELYRVMNSSLKAIRSYSYEYENFTTVFNYVAHRKGAQTLPPPAEFDERDYLRLNPDVAAAVADGQFLSGWAHWISFGESEGRRTKGG